MDRIDFLYSLYEDKLKRVFAGKVDSVWATILRVSSATRHKYLDWVIRLYLSDREILSKENFIADILVNFHENKHFLKRKDINAYKDLEALQVVLVQVEGKRTKRQRKRDFKKELISDGHMELVVSDSKVKIYKINSLTAAQFWSRGTRWCTSNKDLYTHYLCSPLFILLLADGSKFQLHLNPYNSMEFADASDRRVDISMFLTRYPVISKALLPYLNHYPMPEFAIHHMHLLSDDMLVANAAASQPFLEHIPADRLSPALSERLGLVTETSVGSFIYVDDETELEDDLSSIGLASEELGEEDSYRLNNQRYRDDHRLVYHGYSGLPAMAKPTLDDVLEDLQLLEVAGTMKRFIKGEWERTSVAKAILLNGEEAVRATQSKREFVDFFLWVLDDSKIPKPSWLTDMDCVLNHAYEA